MKTGSLTQSRTALSELDGFRQSAKVIGVLILLAAPVLAQGGYREEQRIYPPGERQVFYFGESIDVANTEMVVGARVPELSNSGVAYAFEFDQTSLEWVYRAALLPPSSEVGDHFGALVVTAGGTVFASAPGRGPEGRGSVFRFKKVAGQWPWQEEIRPTDLEAGARFGSSLSTDGDRLIAGASCSGTSTGPPWPPGEVYVYRRAGGSWNLEQRIPSPLPSSGQYRYLFGADSTIHEDLAVVGAPGDYTAGANAGAVHVYRSDGQVWSLEQTLYISDAEAYDEVGGAIHTDGERIIIGVRNKSNGGSYRGAVYIFSHDGQRWHEEERLTAYDSHDYHAYGDRVRILGARAAVAGRLDGETEFNSGAVYLYEWDGSSWKDLQKLKSEPPIWESMLGLGLDFDGRNIVAGAPVTVGQPGTVHWFNTDEAFLTAPENPHAGDAFSFEVSELFGEAGGVALVVISCSGTEAGIRLPGDGRFLQLTPDGCTSFGLSLSPFLSATIGTSWKAKTPSMRFPDLGAGFSVWAAAVSIDLHAGRFVSLTEPIKIVQSSD